MNKYEKDELSCLPSKYRPMTVWSYIGYNLLFGLPVIGFICIIIFSCLKGNICRRSYARYWLLVTLIIMIIIGIIIGVLIGTGIMEQIINSIREAIPLPE